MLAEQTKVTRGFNIALAALGGKVEGATSEYNDKTCEQQTRRRHGEARVVWRWQHGNCKPRRVDRHLVAAIDPGMRPHDRHRRRGLEDEQADDALRPGRADLRRRGDDHIAGPRRVPVPVPVPFGSKLLSVSTVLPLF